MENRVTTRDKRQKLQKQGMMDLSLTMDPSRSAYAQQQQSPPSLNLHHFLPSHLASDASAQHLDAALPNPPTEHSFLPYTSGPYPSLPSSSAAYPTLSSWIAADVATSHVPSQHYPLYGYGAYGLAPTPSHSSLPPWTPEQYRPQQSNPWELYVPPGFSHNTAPSYSVGSDLVASSGHDIRMLGIESTTFETKTAAMLAPRSNIHHKASEKNKLSVKCARAKTFNPSSPGWCSVCQRNCVTEVALRQHLDGKAHKKQVERQKLTAEAVLKSSNEDGKGVANILEKMWLQVSMVGKPARSTRKKVTAAVAPPEMMNTKESLRCNVCNIECNNNTILDIHLGGKKHAARLKKLQRTTIACDVSQLPSITQMKILPQTGRASQDDGS